jgi:hypothetical protein
MASRILEQARLVFPAARDVKVVECRAGANAWMIATHSGVTLGALLGRLIADESGRDTPSPMLAPFRPDRFTASRAPLER